MAGVGAGRPNCVLANTRNGGVRWRPLHPQWPAGAIPCEHSHPQVCYANFLCIHPGLGRILYREQTQDRRYAYILAGWFRRIRGDIGVKGGGRWSPGLVEASTDWENDLQ